MTRLKFYICLIFASYLLFAGNKNRLCLEVQAVFLLKSFLIGSDYFITCEKQRWNNVYVTIPIEIAGTVKLMATPEINSNLIVDIRIFGIKNYTILP